MSKERDYDLVEKLARLPDDTIVGTLEVAAMLNISPQSIRCKTVRVPDRLIGLSRKMQWRIGDVRAFIRGQKTEAAPASSARETPPKKRGRPTKAETIAARSVATGSPAQGVRGANKDEEVWVIVTTRLKSSYRSVSPRKYARDRALLRAGKLTADGRRVWVENPKTQERIFENIAEQAHRAECLRMQSGTALRCEDLHADLGLYFDLSSRVRNCIMAENVFTLEELAGRVERHGWEGLEKVPNFGVIGMAHLQAKVGKAVDWCLRHGAKRRGDGETAAT